MKISSLSALMLTGVVAFAPMSAQSQAQSAQRHIVQGTYAIAVYQRNETTGSLRFRGCVVMEGGRARPRVLDWGGQTLDVAIARELDCAPSEAEPLKRDLSLSAAGWPEELTQEQAERAREAVRRQLQTFARELVSSLQFYQNQPGSLGIGEIALTGGTAHLPGLGAELERLIGVPVRVIDPLTRVTVSKKVREREQVGSLAVAIGLGIED
jgi:type IV pilus assembly protein PilM